MGLNTYPYNQFPASTDKLDEAHNEQIQAEIDLVKSELTNLDNAVNGDAITYPYADSITIEDAVPSNLADCSVKTEPVQDLHGQSAPYVGGAGKNKLPLTVDGIKEASSGTWTGNKKTINSVEFEILTDESNNVTGISAKGTASLETFFTIANLTIGSDECILNGCPSGGGWSTYFMYWHGTSDPKDMGNGVTINDPNVAGNVQIHISSGYAIDTVFYPMLRLATESDATFAPYTNICTISGHTEVDVQVADDAESPTVTKTYTIALGDTVYGGTVDFNTGVMTVDRALIEYDGSTDEAWVLNGSGTDTFYYQCSVALNTNRQSISNMLIRYGTNNFSTGVVGFCITNNGLVRVRTPQEMTVEDFNTWLSNNNLQLCYELATPTTIQLTPKQIQLLKGTNTISASTGQISVTVNGVSGAIGSVQTQANATDAALAELAEQLPDAPTTDGAYVLTVTVDGGTPTYSWDSAE